MTQASQELEVPPDSFRDHSTNNCASGWIQQCACAIKPQTNHVEAGWEGRGAAPIYVARARLPSNPDLWIAGKVSLAQANVAYIGYDGQEIEIKRNYELLLAVPGSVRWVGCHTSSFHVSLLNGAVPVKAGDDIYIARASHENGVHSGKVFVGQPAYIPYDGREYEKKDFQVLVWSDSIRPEQ